GRAGDARPRARSVRRSGRAGLAAGTGDALHHLGGAVVLAARRHARDPARHHRQRPRPAMNPAASAEADELIERSAQRLFAAEVDKACRERVESGAFDERLWRLAVDSGFSLALASERAGGSAMTWSAAAPILLAAGEWQVPLPLAETMIGA